MGVSFNNVDDYKVPEGSDSLTTDSVSSPVLHEDEAAFS